MFVRAMLAGTLLLASCAGAADDRGIYAGLLLGDYEFESPPAPRVPQPDTAAFIGRVGYGFTNLWAAELRYGNTFANDPFSALFLRADVPFGATDLYLLAGASHVRPNGVSFKREDHPAAGVGIELHGNRGMSFDIEYATYSDEALSGAALGFTYRFQ